MFSYVVFTFTQLINFWSAEQNCATALQSSKIKTDTKMCSGNKHPSVMDDLLGKLDWTLSGRQLQNKT